MESVFASGSNSSKTGDLLKFVDAGPYDLVKYSTSRNTDSPDKIDPYDGVGGDAHVGKIRANLSHFRTGGIIPGKMAVF